MGKFANEYDGEISNLGPTRRKPGTNTMPSEFDALGHPVPMYRRAAAYEHAKAMGCTDKQKTFSCIQRMADFIERDNPHAAMETALAHPTNPDGIVDVTGVYRLLAVLLTATQPETKPVAKAEDQLVYSEWGF